MLIAFHGKVQVIHNMNTFFVRWGNPDTHFRGGGGVVSDSKNGFLRRHTTLCAFSYRYMEMCYTSLHYLIVKPGYRKLVYLKVYPVKKDEKSRLSL